MKTLISGLLTAFLIFAVLFLSVIGAFSQVKPANNQAAIPGERKFALVEYIDSVKYNVIKLYTEIHYIHEGSITKSQLPPDTAIIYWAEDGVSQYIGTTTWTLNTLFDTVYTVKETYDDPSGIPSRWTIANIGLAKPTAKPGVYNSSFSFVGTTSSPSSASTTFIGDRVEFFGERFSGHGNVKISIDGVQMAIKNQGDQPWVTDFSRLQPSFYYTFPKEKYNSPPKTHTITFETTPGNQYIIDMIRVKNYTLTPRPKK